MRNKFYLEIESDPNNLIIVEEFVNYCSVELNINKEKISSLLLAVTEAVTNAIIHANKNDKSKLVKISVERKNQQLIITVKDQGNGFDPSKVPDPTIPENLLKDSGRGVYLMRFYTDELKFNITPEGTETILILNLKE
ncbi:MAG TPA: ATP-binding protein [Ignavibacteria bacterium]|nr:ATP-binding protein [Ignavibacteria bacterium]